MGVNWNALVVAAVVFLVALGVQSFVQKWASNTAVRIYWNETVENARKLIRQDVGGIIAALCITNALLAAILAVLIFHP